MTPDDISDAVERLLLARRCRLTVVDTYTGEPHGIDAATAAAPDGMLPAILCAADALWKHATGHGFGLRLERDPDALAGYRAAGLDNAPASLVLLASLDAIEAATGPDNRLVLNELNGLWAEAWRAAADSRPAPSPAP